MNRQSNKNYVSCALLLSLVVLLPACWPFDSEKKEERSVAPAKVVAQDVVVSIDGSPAITAEDFKRNVDVLKQSQPMLDQMLPALPEDQQRMFFTQVAENLIIPVLVEDHIQQQGWADSDEYKKTAEQFHRDLDRELANREFMKRTISDLSISDRDAKKTYESMRLADPMFRRAPFMLSSEGVKAFAVKAKDEKEAKAIVEAAKKNNDLKKAAAQFKQVVKDLGIVTARSTEPDRMVVVKALSMEKVPAVDMVKSGNQYWVVQGVSKQDAQFAPFEQVKEYVKEILANKRAQELYLEAVGKLKGKKNIAVNKDFIEALIVKAPQAPVAEMPTGAGDK